MHGTLTMSKAKGRRPARKRREGAVHMRGVSHLVLNKTKTAVTLCFNLPNLNKMKEPPGKFRLGLRAFWDSGLFLVWNGVS